MRQFVSSVFPDSNGLLLLSGKDFHYLKNVLRLKVGDMAAVSLPGGGLVQSTVCKIDGAEKKMLLQVCGAAEQDGTASDKNGAPILPRRSRLALLQFVPKPQKMELIVRQAAECGIKNIVPVLGEYTQGGSEHIFKKAERFEKIIKEARQQSGSQVETKIFSPMPLSAALDLLEGENFWEDGGASAPLGERTAKIFLYEKSERSVPLADALLGVPAAPDVFGDSSASGTPGNVAAPKSCVFAVGSEGGISPGECNLLLSRGFFAVHFNTNILRCETAALYAAAAIQSALDN